MSEPKNSALDASQEMRYPTATMRTIHTNELPETVAKYLEAANRFDAAGATACFTPDAIVRDEQKDYQGAAAIMQWVLDTSREFRPHVTVIRAEMRGDALRMAGKVVGDFPGSPVELNYEIRLRDNKIDQLTIQ